jgi:6-pyruvoyltetrahydropterin/6-carboxytetrahydropterin synthase
MLTCTKSYPHELGLSCVFRQHRAESHCKLLHGYALAFTFVFGCTGTDENGWVFDFGGLKPTTQCWWPKMTRSFPGSLNWKKRG